MLAALGLARLPILAGGGPGAIWAAAAATGDAPARNLQQLKQAQKVLQRERARLRAEEKAAERKRARLLERARGLSDDDLQSMLISRAVANAKAKAKAEAKAAAKGKAKAKAKGKAKAKAKANGDA